MTTWIEFWNAEHSIYVNDRHKQLHAQAVARDIIRHVPGDVLGDVPGDVSGPSAVVLDYGCGEALYAEAIAPLCGKLILCDAAPRICADLAHRLAGVPNVDVIEPPRVEQMPDGTLDLIVVNSVLQYLARPVLETLLDTWRIKLKPDGSLVIADVIPPGVSPVRDAAALLSFATRGGFVLPALGGLVRTALSDYGRIRKQLGFSTYAEREFIEMLAKHRLVAERVRPNFGHNQARMTFRARRSS